METFENESGFIRYDLPLAKNEINNASVFVAKLPNDKRYTQITHYESVQDFISENEHNIYNSWTDRLGIRAMGEKWLFGTDYYDEKKTTEAIKNGKASQKIVDQIEHRKNELFKLFPELSDLQRTAFTKKRRRVFAEEGAELDIDRYMSGEVECWQKKVVRNEKKAVRLFLNGALSASHNADAYTKNAILFAAISDILNNAGIATEIVVGKLVSFVGRSVNYSTDCEYWNIQVVAKKAHEPLDIQKLLSLCVPGFFRFHSFWQVTNKVIGKILNEGLGIPDHDSETKHFKAIKEFCGFDIVAHGATILGAPELVIGQLATALGVSLGETYSKYHQSEQEEQF